MSTLATKVRARTLGLTLAAACAASLPVYALQQTQQQRTPASKQENIGVVTGIVVGALAGGAIGEHYHKQQIKNATLTGDLSKSETERATLTKNVSQLDETVSHTDQL